MGKIEKIKSYTEFKCWECKVEEKEGEIIITFLDLQKQRFDSNIELYLEDRIEALKWFAEAEKLECNFICKI